VEGERTISLFALGTIQFAGHRKGNIQTLVSCDQEGRKKRWVIMIAIRGDFPPGIKEKKEKGKGKSTASFLVEQSATTQGGKKRKRTTANLPLFGRHMGSAYGGEEGEKNSIHSGGTMEKGRGKGGGGGATHTHVALVQRDSKRKKKKGEGCYFMLPWSVPGGSGEVAARKGRRGGGEQGRRFHLFGMEPHQKKGGNMTTPLKENEWTFFLV